MILQNIVQVVSNQLSKTDLKQKLPQLDALRNGPIYGLRMRAYAADRKDINGVDLLADASMKAGFLVVKDRGTERMQEISLEHLVITNADHNQWYFLSMPNGLDLENSYIAFGGAPTAGEAIRIEWAVSPTAIGLDC